ncbi:MAG TPA: helix-turn-helix transcriptional regulator [Abditibacteriaceae bacterium]|jgi:DNA-binding XRE family transcriptional regulator
MEKKNEPRNLMREVRNALDLTQEEMARELRSSVSTVAKCEAESRLPRTHATRDNFNKLAERAKISLDK